MISALPGRSLQQACRLLIPRWIFAVLLLHLHQWVLLYCTYTQVFYIWIQDHSGCDCSEMKSIHERISLTIYWNAITTTTQSMSYPFFVCYFMLVLNVTKTWNIRLQYYSNLVVIYYSQEPSPQIIWTWTVLRRVVEMALHTCLWKCDDKGLIIYKLEMMFERKAAITFKPIIYSFKKANNKLLAHTLVR